MGTAGSGSYQRWAERRAKSAEEPRGSFLPSLKRMGMPSHQTGWGVGGLSQDARLPEKCHHLSTMTALAGESRATRNTRAFLPSECILAHQTSGCVSLLLSSMFSESYHRQELEDTSALNLLCQGNLFVCTEG